MLLNNLNFTYNYILKFLVQLGALIQIKKIFFLPQRTDKFNKFMKFWELPRFILQKVQYIPEYCDVMKLIIVSLDFFQG